MFRCSGTRPLVAAAIIGGVDAGEHCCEDMADDLARTCDQHADRFDCADCLIDYIIGGDNDTTSQRRR